ncbi:MAG: group III truncated hemoglobin [Pseudomonadota bacterium]
MHPLARFAISPAQIDAVVASFYQSVRSHPTLAPIFASHVNDWPVHETKIALFWRNAILLEGGYGGNPMAVHKAAGNVHPGMFDAWLALFDATLTRELPPETAQAWSALAHRIGRGPRYGLVDSAKTASGIPILR